MSKDLLTPEAQRENATMLAASLGLTIDEASEALEFDIVITAAADDKTALLIGSELELLLARTVRQAVLNRQVSNPTLEVLIGETPAVTDAQSLRITTREGAAQIGRLVEAKRCDEVHGIWALLTACYGAAAAMQAALSGRLPFNVPDPLLIRWDEFGLSADALAQPVNLGHAYLAGAGAIGNAFLWAGRYLDFRGQLEVVDDDTVSSGNLNRQIWFTKDDIGKPKAARLCLHAQPCFKHLALTPRSFRLQNLPERSEGAWLPRLIVAVDSRRARRALQDEFPGEVFDASTTDIREVVVHYHRQPASGACLSCIYESDEQENSREQHIADHLGVSLADVRSERISAEGAVKIASRYPHLKPGDIEGIAYDTLFKQMCGEGHLKTLEGRRVVAPFAFVSVLAGCLLALEVVRRLTQGNATDFNYWRVSPWHPPLARRRILRPRQSNCSFCGNRIKQPVNIELWGTAR